MADRALLHRTHLQPFKEWLALHGHLWRDGRGDFQVLQVLQGHQWHCIYERLKMPEHYTVTGPLTRLVRQFIKDYQRSRACKPQTDQPLESTSQFSDPPF